MDPYSALIVPGFLTILVVVLSWIYLRNVSRLASKSLTTEVTSTVTRTYENRDEEKEELGSFQVCIRYKLFYNTLN